MVSKLYFKIYIQYLIVDYYPSNKTNIITNINLIDLDCQHKSQQMMELSQSDIQCQHILYTTPPNIDDCYRHRKANIIFKNITESVLNEPLIYNYCECCGRIIGKQPKLRFKYDPIEAAYLGPGIPLFFAFYRSILYMLGTFLVVFCIYTTLANFNGSYCETQCGNVTFWSRISEVSVFNVFDQYRVLQVQAYFSLAAIIITIFMNVSIRSYLNYLQIYIDEFFATPSCYSIIVRNIPEDAQKQDIQQMVQRMRESLEEDQIQKTDDLKIIDILMVKQLKEFLQVQKKNLKAIKDHIKRKETNRSLGQVYFQNPVIPDKFARTAIIIFSSAYSKYLFLDCSSELQRLIRTLWGSYYPRSNVHQIKDSYVSVYRAPQPDDLIWENCGKRDKQLLVRRISLYFLSFLVLAIGGGLQYSVQVIRRKYITADQGKQVLFSFSLGSALLITVFNFLISKILEFMAYHQGHDTKTQLKVAMTFRIVLFQFLNSGVFVVMSSIFVVVTMSQQGKAKDFQKAVLAFNITQLMVVNAILQNLMTYFFNKFQVFSIYQRRQILKTKKLYPQIQANSIFEPPNINIHFKYAYIFKTFWLTVFFMPTMPIVIVISMLGLMVHYWLQKYLFSGVYRAPQTISGYLSNHVLNLLDYTPLWMTMGSLFVHLARKNFVFEKIQSDIKALHYLFFILSAINVFFPYHAIIKRLGRHRQPQPSQSSYNEALCTFELTYEDTNPIYLNHHKKRIREQQIFKQQITKQTQFQQMKLKLSQTQIIQKSTILNKSLITVNQMTGPLTRHRSSSLNY